MVYSWLITADFQYFEKEYDNDVYALGEPAT